MLSQLYLQFFILLLFAATSYAQPNDAATTENVQAVNRTVINLYEAYSFEDGNYPATEDILAHFTDDAILSYISDGSLVTKPVAEYFEQWQKSNRVNGIEFLQEVEINGRTDIFKSVAHRISSAKFTARGQEESSGLAVISLQLAQVNGKWLVHTMLWQSLGEGESLPLRYRQKE